MARKTALVTGSAGFVGRHMVMHLDMLGWNVKMCDLKYGDDDPFSRDANFLFQTETDRFDLVVHCAYHVGGRVEIDGKPANLHLNAQLDSNLFQWAVATRQPRVLYFSSSAAYPIALQEDLSDYRLNESDISLDYPFLPDGRYGAAKLFGERMAEAARDCGVKVTVVRPFSGYGTDQDLSYPFPAFIHRAAQRTDPFVVWGTYNQRRDFIHINDVIAGAMAVLESGTTDPINLCTGRSTTFYDLVKMIAVHFPDYDPEITSDTTKPMGVLNRVGNPTQFHKYYTPKVDLEEGIARALGKWKGM